MVDVEGRDDEAELGGVQPLRVTVDLGSLNPDDVQVQVIHGRVAPHGALADHRTTVLARSTNGEGSKVVFEGAVPCEVPGRYGYTVRVAPAHPHLPSPLDLGRVTWA